MHRAVLLGAVLAFMAAGSAVACPDPSAAPSGRSISLTENFPDDPHTVNAAAGGAYSLAECGFGVTGWVAAAPDFVLSYSTSGGLPLTIAVNSSADTVILVLAPDGQFYFDADGAPDLGLAAGALVFFPRPMAGQYRIWIGSAAEARGLPATLTITELLS
ncbi:MAG: hypothetical protein KIS96_05015 [Bauldia sp.]|nr:hypothetical protein [Bauldia sp.]